jgi:hypothetical protein
MLPRPNDQPRSAAPDVAVRYLIEAEAHARQAARLVELAPDADARRDARILYRAAMRIRARRLEGA